MEKHDSIVILITSATGQASHIAEVLLHHRKAACVNIVPEVNSLFWWQGKPDSARESLIIVKTRASLLSEVIALVKEVHSDEVPEIIALPIVGGNQNYLDWIVEETR